MPIFEIHAYSIAPTADFPNSDAQEKQTVLLEKISWKTTFCSFRAYKQKVQPMKRCSYLIRFTELLKSYQISRINFKLNRLDK